MGPIYYHGSISIRAWIRNYIHHEMCDESFIRFQTSIATVKGWEWISNFITNLARHVITNRYWDLRESMLVIGAPDVRIFSTGFAWYAKVMIYNKEDGYIKWKWIYPLWICHSRSVDFLMTMCTCLKSTVVVRFQQRLRLVWIKFPAPIL